MKKWRCLVEIGKSSYLRAMNLREITCYSPSCDRNVVQNEEGFVATIGFFDGVHRGHMHLLAQLWKVAQQRSMRPLVITFDVHPRQVLHADFQPQLLTSLDEKVRLIRGLGFEEIAVLQFSKEMAALSPLAFMREILCKQLSVSVLLMGYDHRFGHGGGTLEEYKRWGNEVGIQVLTAERMPGEKVSSSVVRNMLIEGNVDAARKLLGRPYEVSGVVVHGKALGRQIGFPTANVSLKPAILCPKTGVYAVRVRLEDDSLHNGMLCVGSRPTLEDGRGQTIEVHLFDYEGDLYGKSLTIAFHAFLREEMKFDSVSDLQNQLSVDKCLSERLLNV